jgi:hypothetical protein
LLASAPNVIVWLANKQVISPAFWFVAAFDAVAVAVLVIAVHAEGLVAAETTAVNELPAGNVPTVQFRACDPTPPVTVQPVPEDRVHVTPPPAGSGSAIAVPHASPVPLLVATTVNVAVSPTVTIPPSGEFATVSVGAVTVDVCVPPAPPTELYMLRRETDVACVVVTGGSGGVESCDGNFNTSALKTIRHVFGSPPPLAGPSTIV